MDTSRDHTPFQLELFGGPRLLRNGKLLPLTAHQEWLLCLLGFPANAGISRHQLLDFFWSQGPESVRRRRLNQLLYSIRKRLGGALPVVTGRRFLRLDRRLISLDLLAFQASLESRDLPSLHGYLDRPLFDRLERAPTASLEHWLHDACHSFYALVLEALLGMIYHAEATGEWQDVESAAILSLQLSPDHEEACQYLLRALHIQHRASEAKARLASFLKANRIANPEWQPSSITTAIGRALNRRLLDEPKTDPVICPGPLIGRQSELLTIVHALRGGSGRRPHILVVGPTGSGKTRLVQESLTNLESHDIPHVQHCCLPVHRAVQGATLRQLLALKTVRFHLQRSDREWFERLPLLHDSEPGDELSGRSSSTGPPKVSDASHIAEGLRHFLGHLSRSSHIILALDDCHQMDDYSFMVLKDLFCDSTLSLPFIMTFALSPDGDDGCADDRLKQLRGAHTQTMKLKALPREDVRHFLPFLKSPQIDSDLCRAIWIGTSGLPVYLNELRMEVATGRQTASEKRGGALLRSVVSTRVRELPQASRRLLFLLALARIPLRRTVIGDCLTFSEEELASAVNHLTHMTWAVLGPRGLSLTDDLVSQAVASTIPRGTALTLHTRLAEALTSQTEVRHSLVAVHRLQAGDFSGAVPYLQQGLQEAEQLGLYREHVAHFELAAESTSDLHMKIFATHQLGRLLCKWGDLARGTQALVKAGRLGVQLGVDEGDVLEMRVSLLEAQSGDPARDAGMLTARASTLQNRAHQVRRYDLVARICRQLLHLFDEAGHISGFQNTLQLVEHFAGRADLDPRERIAFQMLACARLQLTEPKEVMARIAATVSGAKRLGNPTAYLAALNWELIALYHAGEVNSDAGIRSRRHALEAARACNDHAIKFQHALNSGVWYLDTMDLDNAEMAFEEAQALLGDSTAPQWRRRLLVNLAELALLQGRLGEAEDGFREGLCLAPQTATDYGRMLCQAGLGLVALAQRRRSRADQYFEHLWSARRFWTSDPTLVLRFLLRYSHGGTLYSKVADHARLVARSVWDRSLPWRLRLALLLAEHPSAAEGLVNPVVFRRLLNETIQRDLREMERRLRTSFSG